MAGTICALVALPIALWLGEIATKTDWVRALFFGSDWFTFKAVVGAVEILVFGLVAYLTETLTDTRD